MKWLKRVWPFSAVARRYDTFVANLKTEVIFKASSSLEESFASAKAGFLDSLERVNNSAKAESLESIRRFNNSVENKSEGLKAHFKEVKTAADSAVATVKDLSARLSVVEKEYGDVRKTNESNKTLAEETAKNLKTARTSFEAAKTKYDSALSTAMAAQTAYGNASRENAEAIKGALELSDLKGRVETALEELKTSRESSDVDFERRREALFSELREKGLSEVRREFYFSSLSAEQRRLLVELAVDFDYDTDRLKNAVEDKRKGVKDSDPNRAAYLQKLISTNKIIDSFVTKADASGMEIKDFARMGVKVLRERDPDFEQRYETAEKYKTREANQQKRQ